MWGKLWWESKTIWAGVIEVLIAVLLAVAGSEVVAAYPQVASLILGAAGIAAILLRLITGKPIVSSRRQ